MLQSPPVALQSTLQGLNRDIIVYSPFSGGKQLQSKLRVRYHDNGSGCMTWGYKMKAEEMGKFICEVRKEKHMTQADLARTLHVTSQAISKWERGLGFPDIGTLQPLSEALDVSLEELMNAARHAPADDVFSPEEAVQNIISIAENINSTERRHITSS